MSIIDHGDPKPMFKQKRKKKVKPSMKALFGEIWNERFHVCCNCYGNLGRDAKSWFFSHNNPKSTHPHLKYEKKNISLRCFTDHELFDQHKMDEYHSRTGINLNKDVSGFGAACP